MLQVLWIWSREAICSEQTRLVIVPNAKEKAEHPCMSTSDAGEERLSKQASKSMDTE